MNSNQKHTISI